MDRTMKVAWGSLAVSIVVLAMKAGAYRLTGSLARYSDALETVINVALRANNGETSTPRKFTLEGVR